MRLAPAQLLSNITTNLWWVPDEATAVQRDDLVMVSCERPVAHLNMVMRIRAGPNLESLLDEVDAAHGQGVSRVMVRDIDAPEALAPALLRRGYTPDHPHDAAVLPTVHMKAEAHPRFVATPVATLEDLRALYRVASLAFSPTSPTEEELRQYLHDCTRAGRRSVRFIARDTRDGAVVAAGGLNLDPSMGLLWGGGTIPSARRQGAYRALLNARVSFAHAHGIPWVGLYARHGTSAPIVARHGFRRVGSMTMWCRIGSA